MVLKRIFSCRPCVRKDIKEIMAYQPDETKKEE